MEEKKPTMIGKLKKFLKQCQRVLTVSTKPDKYEFIQSTKITGIGIIIIGLIGFVIFIIFRLLSLS